MRGKRFKYTRMNQPQKKRKKTTEGGVTPNPRAKKKKKKSQSEAVPCKVPCCHCDYQEAVSNFVDVNANLVSESATICLICERCVCHACYSARYAPDIRYQNSKDSEFVCLNCIK